ncbi:MAG: histidine phosphatase family protein [Chloroflexi bacterium]|nr:histidine phosphatase family protein [Chloroflexota bacterium]
MPNLILIRHSASQPDSSIPANQWRLSHRGRQLCKPLAEKLSVHQPTLLVSSIEPKAIETAQLTAEHLGIESDIANGLHEHERSNVPFMLSQESFEGRVQAMFEKPGEVVFGTESANQALERFSAAIDNLLKDLIDETLALVTHGTVMSLFVARANSLDAHGLWSTLGMPAFVVLELPKFKVVTTLENLDLNN